MEKNENGYPRTADKGKSGGCTGGAPIGNGGGCNGGTGGNQVHNGDGCGPMGNGCSTCLDDMPLAYAYVPMQRWQMLYPIDKGLMRGTLFEELDKPTEVYGNEW